MIWLAALALGASATRAEIPRLLADINKDPRPSPGIDPWDLPSGFRPAGSRLVFRALRTAWITDGTDAGTRALSPPIPAGWNVDVVGGVRDSVVLVASTSTELRLWVSDGTRQGTRPLRGPMPRAGDYRVSESVSTAGLLFFTVCQAPAACDLWQTDGTSNGTEPTPFSSGGPRGGAGSLVATRDRVYFVSSTDGHWTVWTSDGTAEGGLWLADLSFEFPLLTAAANLAFFTVGPDLWSSDGSLAGTHKVASFRFNGCTNQYQCNFDTYSYPEVLSPDGNAVIFAADDGFHDLELWRSNGTTPQRLTELPASSHPDAASVRRVGNRLLFIARDGRRGPPTLWRTSGVPGGSGPLFGCGGPCAAVTLVSADTDAAPGHTLFLTLGLTGTRLWQTNGTAAGTHPLAVVCATDCSSGAASLGWHSGRHHFLLEVDGSRELWASDGTRAGTERLASRAVSPVIFENRVVFGTDRRENRVAEIWSTTGTAATTRMVARVARVEPGSILDIAPLEEQALLYALVDNTGQRQELWLSGGTPETTEPVPGARFESDSAYAMPLLTVGPLHFFGAIHPERSELWRTDGSGPGTTRLAQVSGRFFAWSAWRDGLLFVLLEDERCSFWFSDGRVFGTRLLFALPEGFRCPTALTSFGDGFLFVARTDSETGPAPGLFRCDGTVFGIESLIPPRLAAEPSYPVFTRAGDEVFFGLDVGEGMGLWRTDGTAQGTRQVGDFQHPADLVEFQGGLFFTADSVASPLPRTLWRLDLATGNVALVTEAGAHLVEVWGTSPVSSQPTPAQDGLYFLGNDGTHGLEVWRTDGTEAGTAMLRDIRPGPESSNPWSLAVAGAAVFFTADDGDHGSELWRSDSERGARLITDLAPGPLGSNPHRLLAIGRRLLFAADDGVYGREPWALSPDDSAACVADSTALCLAGDRLIARAQVTGPDGEHDARAVPVHGAPGAFALSSPTAPDLLVKWVDGRAFNGHEWIFFGSLVPREFTLTITDVETGASRRYVNGRGQRASVGDTEAFGPMGSHGSAIRATTVTPGPRVAGERIRVPVEQPCLDDHDRVCFADGRFRVVARWRDATGQMRTAETSRLDSETAAFWFFRPEWTELAVRVRSRIRDDGTPAYAVAFAGLTDLEFEIVVTDTATGQARSYRKPRGEFLSGYDPEAFPP